MKTRQGTLTVSLKDRAIGKRLYCKGEFEFQLSTRILAFLRRQNMIPSQGRGTVMDIGANVGVIGIGMLVNQEVESAIALEPEPLNFNLLTRNVAQNNLEQRCLCFPYAASNDTGSTRMSMNESNYGDHRVIDARSDLHPTSPDTGIASTIEVRSIRIDELFTEHADCLDPNSIDLIWVDVQGYEGFVFQGAESLLQKKIPVVSELWPYGMRKVGMANAEFSRIAATFWSRFWETDPNSFTEHPIGDLPEFLEPLTSETDFVNVIFYP